jgi:integrase
MPALTVAAVRKYAAGTVRREIRDSLAPGLHLVIQPKPSGHKSWAMRFRRPSGKSGKLVLGRVELFGVETADEPVLGGSLTLRQARQLAHAIDRQRARGIDVVEEYRAQRSRQRAAAEDRAANTFGTVAREFFADHKTKWQTRPRRWREDARLLGLDWPPESDPAQTEPRVIVGSLVAIWAAKPVAEIDGHDIHAAVDEARKHGVPGLARRNGGVSEARGRKMHAALSVLFKWALRHRKVVVNPTQGVWHPGAPPARERVLSDAEIKMFWAATEAVGAPFGSALKLLLLTGCRLNEITGARWDELSEDGSALCLPSGRTKNHRAHVVPLSPLAREVIAAVPRVEGPFVFTTTGTTPISGWSKAKQELDTAMGAGVPPWRLHDLRRTAASGMQRLGVRAEVIERALNHVSGSYGGVAGIYQRDPLADEVRTALERWAAHVQGVASGTAGAVVTLRGRGRG